MCVYAVERQVISLYLFRQTQYYITLAYTVHCGPVNRVGLLYRNENWRTSSEYVNDQMAADFCTAFDTGQMINVRAKVANDRDALAMVGGCEG